MSGYAATAVCLFPMIDKLREEFEVTLIDVLGFGCSGRPRYSAFTHEEVLEYFNWQFNEWMEKTRYNA